MARTRRTKAQKLELMEQVFRSHCKRRSYDKIAEEFGISKQYVFQLVNAAYASRIAPDIDAQRHKDLELIESLLDQATAHYESNHDPSYFGPVERLIARRAKLLGLDAPVKTESTVVMSTPLDESYKSLLAEMESRDNARSEV